jgi:hypothetical protein
MRVLASKAHHSVPDGEDQGLKPRLDPKFAHEIDHVSVDGFASNVQILGDLLVTQPLSKRRQYVALSRSQAGQSGANVPVLPLGVVPRAGATSPVRRVGDRLSAQSDERQ